jgi:glutamyl-tRNA synthetase
MPVRTRYAPSPTGVPHVGNIRTALFAWLLARHHGGEFLLRIEDTDRSRYEPESVPKIIESLQWLGMDIDGEPVVQSERVEVYRDAARRLIEQGDAYECWCSSERLDAVRAEQARNKQPPRYDRRCRDEAGRAEARREAESEGRGAVVRFKTPLAGEVTLDDAIHGPTTWDVSTLDDFVILKSDGFPTYHLAYMVDDEAMGITHVLRGDEWIPSAPRHQLLYRALGIEPPVIAHLPRILGPDGSKLSKRHGATSVFEYRDQGYLPEAMFNFLGLIGWSLDDRTEIISREDFIRHFTLDRVVKNPAVFNVEKLTWMNGVYIRELPDTRFVELIAGRLDGDLPSSVARPVDRHRVARIAPLIRERIKVLSEVVDYCDFFFLDALHYADDELLGKAFANDRVAARRALDAAITRLQAADDWRHDVVEGELRALAGELRLKGGDLFSLVRVAVTGRRVTPPLFESMDVLGRATCMERLRAARERL